MTGRGTHCAKTIHSASRKCNSPTTSSACNAERNSRELSMSTQRLADYIPTPLGVTLEEGPDQHLILNLGPHHPSTHGVLRLVLELDGEMVVNATPDIGYLHTGIEKTAESLQYQQALVVTDRLDYLAPLSNNLGYTLAVEKLL